MDQESMLIDFLSVAMAEVAVEGKRSLPDSIAEAEYWIFHKAPPSLRVLRLLAAKKIIAHTSPGDGRRRCG